MTSPRDFGRQAVNPRIGIYPPWRGAPNRLTNRRKMKIFKATPKRNDDLDMGVKTHAQEMEERKARREARSERRRNAPVRIPKKRKKWDTTDVAKIRKNKERDTRRRERRLVNAAATAMGRINARQELERNERQRRLELERYQ